MARQDPLRNFRYRLEIDGIEQAGFAEAAVGDLSRLVKKLIRIAISTSYHLLCRHNAFVFCFK